MAQEAQAGGRGVQVPDQGEHRFRVQVPDAKGHVAGIGDEQEVAVHLQPPRVEQLGHVVLMLGQPGLLAVRSDRFDVFAVGDIGNPGARVPDGGGAAGVATGLPGQGHLAVSCHPPVAQSAQHWTSVHHLQSAIRGPGQVLNEAEAHAGTTPFVRFAGLAGALEAAGQNRRPGVVLQEVDHPAARFLEVVGGVGHPVPVAGGTAAGADGDGRDRPRHPGQGRDFAPARDRLDARVVAHQPLPAQRAHGRIPLDVGDAVDFLERGRVACAGFAEATREQGGRRCRRQPIGAHEGGHELFEHRIVALQARQGRQDLHLDPGRIPGLLHIPDLEGEGAGPPHLGGPERDFPGPWARDEFVGGEQVRAFQYRPVPDQGFGRPRARGGGPEHAGVAGQHVEDGRGRDLGRIELDAGHFDRGPDLHRDGVGGFRAGEAGRLEVQGGGDRHPRGGEAGLASHRAHEGTVAFPHPPVPGRRQAIDPGGLQIAPPPGAQRLGLLTGHPEAGRRDPDLSRGRGTQQQQGRPGQGRETCHWKKVGHRNTCLDHCSCAMAPGFWTWWAAARPALPGVTAWPWRAKAIAESKTKGRK